MEHWGHRLFPKMPFDEVIERVEKLGAKRPVQTCMKKIRLDMPVLDEDFVGSDKEDMEGDDVVRNMHNDSPQVQCLFLINYLCLNSLRLFILLVHYSNFSDSYFCNLKTGCSHAHTFELPSCKQVDIILCMFVSVYLQ